ncbi:MAG: hypothetical protein HZY76_16085 [Anaerolineae bacterium]|nr:MAG: hypothetical protein HZY76_16085 [Anaerolineae bacterium]
MGNEQVLWRLATEGFTPLTDALLPGRWDCNDRGIQTCVFADQSGQVYTSTAISPAVPILISPTLPITRRPLAQRRPAGAGSHRDPGYPGPADAGAAHDGRWAARPG